MADTAAEIEVATPQFWDGQNAEIDDLATTAAAQSAIARSLATLHGRATVQERALARLLNRGDVVSADNYLYVGEIPTGQFKQIYIPDEVTMRGMWRVHSIFAASDASASVDLQVKIHDFPAGIDWIMLAPKAAVDPVNYSIPIGRVIRPSEFDKIGLALANGGAGDKCVVTFNFERIR